MFKVEKRIIDYLKKNYILVFMIIISKISFDLIFVKIIKKILIKKKSFFLIFKKYLIDRLSKVWWIIFKN